MQQQTQTIIRHVAEAVSGTVIGSAYVWLPFLEQGLRVAVAVVGLFVGSCQGYLAWQAIREKRAAKLRAPVERDP
jgi:hydrogenase/urease accessory protein HupE